MTLEIFDINFLLLFTSKSNDEIFFICIYITIYQFLCLYTMVFPILTFNDVAPINSSSLIYNLVMVSLLFYKSKRWSFNLSI